MLCVLVAVLSGCAHAPIETAYGASQFPEATTSVNGLAVFQKLCAQSGVRTMQARRLSPRLSRTDHLLLVGDTFHPPAKEARDWLEDWLAKQTGRTVIYFGRDFGAETYLYEKTLEQLSSDQQSRARLDLAQQQSRLDMKFYSQINDDVFCRWFVLRSSKPQRWLTGFAGPLSHLMSSESSWPVRTFLDTPDPELQTNKPTWTKTNLTPATRFPNRPARADSDARPTVFNAYWTYGDINDDATWNSEWEKAPQAEVLLEGDDGTPLITELTSPRYPGSRIVTIANGAPLFNATLIDDSFRQLAAHLVGQFAEGSRLAILPFSNMGIQISEVPEEEDEVTGLSVLVTWPLNIIMAHLAILGIMICLALFPIYGRPQSLPAPALSDFGQHAEALGQWLSRTGDTQLAAKLTADYLRTVRGESLPEWLQSATVAATPASTSAMAHTPSPSSRDYKPPEVKAP